MSLEEEIAINQFAQGVHSHERLLARFSQLDEAEKRRQYMELSFRVWQLEPTESDAAQALLNSSLGKGYAPGTKVIKSWMSTSGLEVSGKDPIKEYTFLLYTYKVAYQRKFATARNNPARWIDQDLSNPETVQAILDTHQSMVEQLYSDPGFRSEFTTLARHWKRHFLPKPEDDPEITPVRQTKFTFLSYQEVVNAFTLPTPDPRSDGIALVYEALVKALIIRYDVTKQQGRRLTLDVVTRHWQADDCASESL
ncbi:DUF5958 family protein [Spirosoma rigui]|uniref:DUF5958 family protein n=1 Tax=Spirosoma rigui TaxID=564064 RepID=UPI0009AF9D22|nr:DUF5958 family protein [Spirosoma rigui]